MCLVCGKRQTRGLCVALGAVALVVFLGPAVAAAQTFAVEYTAEFSVDELVFSRHMGYDLVRLPEDGDLSEPGRPLLPARTLRIALPPGMAVSDVRVSGSESVELPGEFVIFPAQPPRRISDRAPAEFVLPDARTYASVQPYPATLAELSHQADLAGQGMAVVRVCPLQYVGAEKRLILHTSIRLVVEGELGYVCGDYLPAASSERTRALYDRAVRELVVNPDDVVLRSSGQPLNTGRALDPDEVDYVIITTGNWAGGFAPLANWKTKKGVPAAIVDRDWIYASYTGNSNAEKIRKFVQDAYNSWGTRYFLLGGDTNVIPYGSRTFLGDDIPNDTFYADFDYDWVCEVNVGRAAVRDAAGVTTFVNKVLDYEKNPPLTNYIKTAFFMGFDLNQYGSGEGENCKIDMANLYLPADWTYRNEYDSQPGTHKQDCINYLNQGNHLVNHIDHSSTDVMGAGCVNHDQYLTISDMSALNNGARRSIYYTIGCWACDYAADTCIAEAFVRNSAGGGVAFIGNSRYGWYIPFSADGASLRYDRFFFRSLLVQNYYRLGDCVSDHKHDGYQNDEYMRYIFTELTLLGDPEMPVWTQPPRTLTVSHGATLEAGLYTSFPVTVSWEGAPVPQATVCLWKDGDVYEVAQTDAAGTAAFWFAALTTGPMAVTASKHNYFAYEGQAQVVAGVPPYVLTVLIVGSGSVSPNPPGSAYAAGTPVQLTATAGTKWCFDHWEGALQGSANPETIVMDGHKIVTAVFAPDCNGNGVADAADLANCPPEDPDCQDCNGNGLLDYCDIASGFSTDCQPNQVPDECDLYAPTYVPAHDNCADAEIVCPGNAYTGSTVGATNDGSATCGDSASSPDVWYYYEPLGSGQLTISLAGSSYDTVVSVHSGVPGTIENQVGCNDDYFGQASYLRVVVQAYQQYWIRVSGRAGATGDFHLTFTGPACEPGTDCNHNGKPDDCDIAGGVSTDLNQNGLPDECEGLGDVNCDGNLDGFDIQPFVTALTNPGQYQATYPNCEISRADINGSGTIDGFDIQGFVTLLTGGK